MMRQMRISTAAQIAEARRSGRPLASTLWQWASVAVVEGAHAVAVAFDNGSGWMHMANVRFDSAEEFGQHVDSFACHAVANGSKVWEEGWV